MRVRNDEPRSLHASPFTVPTSLVRITLLCWLCFALLVLTLDAQSLWWDEGISLHLATSSWAEIIADRARNIHPPLYFFALKVWVGLVGRSPFAARYASTLAMTLLPALVYRFLGRRVGYRTGWAGAFLVALAPPFFIYGQEVRAYAFLPPLVLVLLGYVWLPRRHTSILETGFLDDGQSSARFFRIAGLVLVEVTLCLMHYAGVVAVAWANLAFFVRCLHCKRRRVWVTWTLTLMGVIGLALPWAICVLQAGAVGLKREAGLGNVLDEPIPAIYLLKLLGVFHTVGLPAALADPMLVRPASLVGLLGLLSLIWRMVGNALSSHPWGRKRLAVLWLLLVWLLPLIAVVPLVWSLSPQAHPRYLLPFVLGAWLLGAVLLASSRVPRVLRGGLLAAVLATSVLGLCAYWVEPRYGRSDVRSVAAFIRDHARPGDVALMPPTDWSLSQYDLGVATGAMVPPVRQDAAIAELLAEVTREGQRVYALDYRRGALDLRNQIRTTLAYGGVLQTLQEFPGVLLWEYTLTAQARVSPLSIVDPPVCQEVEPLCLVALAYQADPESGDALPVVLRWTQQGTLSQRYAVSLRLYAPAATAAAADGRPQGIAPITVAASGALVAVQDDVLIDKGLRPTDMWAAPRVVTTYHLLPLPVGLLPRPYRLKMGLYARGDPESSGALIQAGRPAVSTVVLGDVTPKIQPWVEVSAYPLPPAPTEPHKILASGLRLEGAALDRTEVYPGQTVFVTLRWRSPAAASNGRPQGIAPTTVATGALSAVLPRLLLRQEDHVLAEVPVLMDLPPMPADRPMLDHAALEVPAKAVSGPAQVVLSTEAAPLVLGEVWIKADEHIFSVPLSVAHSLRALSTEVHVGNVATLLGYRLETEEASASAMPERPVAVRAGIPFTLTLVWQAEEGASQTDLKVFIHLLGADGGIIAQHDGKPVAWTRPTGGWVPGEILVDQHRLTWQRSEDYIGRATLLVGLYDVNTGARVLWQDGQDAFRLPGSLTVSGPD